MIALSRTQWDQLRPSSHIQRLWVMICVKESYFTNSVAKQILHCVSIFFAPKECRVLNSVCWTQLFGIDAVGQLPSWKNDPAVVLGFLTHQEEPREGSETLSQSHRSWQPFSFNPLSMFSVARRYSPLTMVILLKSPCFPWKARSHGLAITKFKKAIVPVLSIRENMINVINGAGLNPLKMSWIQGTDKYHQSIKIPCLMFFVTAV